MVLETPIRERNAMPEHIAPASPRPRLDAFDTDTLHSPGRTAVRVSVVIPALNEVDNLAHVLPRIPLWVDEILLVDGNSTDGTPEVAKQLRPTVRVIYQEGRGKGDALRAGFAQATGDIVVMLDAD